MCRHFPLAEYSHAEQAAEAAAAQDKFWPMRRLLIAHSQHLRVQEHRRSSELIGVRGSPSFFLNAKVVDVAFGPKHVERAVRAALGED